MLSFQPGPSELWASTPLWFQQGIDMGFFSTYHRSSMFAQVYESIVEDMREKLAVPKEYALYFVSSATECWEIISRNFQGIGLHVLSGIFGEKWANQARIQGNRIITSNPTAQTIDYIAVTQCETSTGFYYTDNQLFDLKKTYPNALIFVDATSSIAGTVTPWETADIWFASVQKCFGLPPGMALMWISPQAIEKAQYNGNHHDIANLDKNYRQLQTTQTPNLVGIWLLHQSLKNSISIHQTQQTLIQRKAQLDKILCTKGLKNYIKNPENQSITVLAIAHEQAKIIQKQALDYQLKLGGGYGPIKETSFRIANFPAISTKSWEYLCTFFTNISI